MVAVIAAASVVVAIGTSACTPAAPVYAATATAAKATAAATAAT